MQRDPHNIFINIDIYTLFPTLKLSQQVVVRNSHLIFKPTTYYVLRIVSEKQWLRKFFETVEILTYKHVHVFFIYFDN